MGISSCKWRDDKLSYNATIRTDAVWQENRLAFNSFNNYDSDNINCRGYCWTFKLQDRYITYEKARYLTAERFETFRLIIVVH